MTKNVDFLLLGGGLASATAAETLRAEGAEGTILILSAEHELPYHRPPLSKRFFLSELPKERLRILSSDYYREHKIDVLLGARAIAVDPHSQTVRTDSQEEIHYGQLLIATGASPVHLVAPGSDLPGLHYLRTEDDAVAIKKTASTAKRAVVIGGSFIGMELAATLTKLGVHVTLIALHEILFDKLNDAKLSEHFHQYYSQHGVDIILGDTVAEFLGKERVTAVITKHGKNIPCDLVVLGIGVMPDVGFLEGSGIAVDDGIVVDRYLRANQPNIFAAGDVANFFDPVFSVRRRVEHWDNAVKQGKLVAKNMLGQRLPYDEISYFFCDVFDISFQFFGMPQDAHEHVEIGSLKENSYALLYMKGNVPRALFSYGRPAKETKAIEALIRYRVNCDRIKTRLQDPNFALEHIPTQTVLILQGGGALGAFECGVVKVLEEEKIYPDIVAGVSIGAFNGAIIASNPRHATEALESFWNELAINAIDLPDERLRRMLSSWQSLMFGSPNFFQPRWLQPIFDPLGLTNSWTSFYDTSPIKQLLAKYVDFQSLKSSPVRLLASAVNVETAELEIFDSYIDDLTVDHILASGSLPPSFPWTTVNGKHYWDGGIVSNSPLEQVTERCGAAGKRVFVVDLFSSKSALPNNLMEVMERRDEIVYAERIRRDTGTQSVVRDFQKLVDDILGFVEPQTASQLKQRPRYIQLMGDVAPMEVTRIIREEEEGESPSRDYDFSRTSIEKHKRAGYAMAKKALRQ
ncbi:MAG: FAD-dependent oxidoreductase [Pseudomonadota bacterium]